MILNFKNQRKYEKVGHSNNNHQKEQGEPREKMQTPNRYIILFLFKNLKT